MNNVFKKWWFWLIVFFVIIVCIIIVICMSKGGVGTPGISKEEYQKINIGMSNFEVNSIIDSKDEWDNDEIYSKCCIEIEKSEKNSVYSYTYKYLGEKSGYATVTYTADYSKGSFFVTPTVTYKKQYNLK